MLTGTRRSARSGPIPKSPTREPCFICGKPGRDQSSIWTVCDECDVSWAIESIKTKMTDQDMMTAGTYDADVMAQPSPG